MALFPKLTTKSNDLLNIDALRFIAAFGVMLFHSARYFQLGSNYDSDRFFGPLRLLVDLFFALSGFVIGYSYLNRVATGAGVWKFWKGRFAYLYPIHFSTFLVALAIGVIGAGHSDHPENFELRCIPANLLLGQAWGMCGHLSFNMPSWSLSAEIMMYLLFPLFVWVAKRKAFFVPLSAATSFALLTWVTWHGSPWYEWTSPSGALRALPSFLFGLSLWLYRDKLRRIGIAHVALYMTSAVAIYCVVTGASYLVILAVIYGVVLFACASDLQRLQTSFVRHIAPLGALTLEIYMIHQLMLTIFVAVVAKRLLGLNGAALNTAILLTLFVVFASAYAAKLLLVDPSKKAIMAFGKREPMRGDASEVA